MYVLTRVTKVELSSRRLIHSNKLLSRRVMPSFLWSSFHPCLQGIFWSCWQLLWSWVEVWIWKNNLGFQECIPGSWNNSNSQSMYSMGYDDWEKHLNFTKFIFYGTQRSYQINWPLTFSRLILSSSTSPSISALWTEMTVYLQLVSYYMFCYNFWVHHN